MSLILNTGTHPNITIKTYGFGDLKGKVFFNNDGEIGFQEFFQKALEILKQEREEGDMRSAFICWAKFLDEGKGFNGGGKKLESPKELKLNTRRWKERDMIRFEAFGFTFTLIDFLFACEYVLLNTDLLPDDPRRVFLSQVEYLP